jgi:hypothetical protein
VLRDEDELMPYTPLPDLAIGDEITAALWDAWVQENFKLSPAAIATAKGDIFPSTGANGCTKLAAGVDGQIVEIVSGAPANSWGFVPIGGIIMWSGALASIPANWQLCDGTNSTPDLRNQFVVGAGYYAVGASSGAATANLEHTHTATTDSDGGHTHTQAATDNGSTHTHNASLTAASASSNAYNVGAYAVATSTHPHDIVTGDVGDHTHNKPDTDSGGAHTHSVTGMDNQLSTAQDIRPPYYALAFIMRLS